MHYVSTSRRRGAAHWSSPRPQAALAWVTARAPGVLPHGGGTSAAPGAESATGRPPKRHQPAGGAAWPGVALTPVCGLRSWLWLARGQAWGRNRKQRQRHPPSKRPRWTLPRLCSPAASCVGGPAMAERQRLACRAALAGGGGIRRARRGRARRFLRSPRQRPAPSSAPRTYPPCWGPGRAAGGAPGAAPRLAAGCAAAPTAARAGAGWRRRVRTPPRSMGTPPPGRTAAPAKPPKGTTPQGEINRQVTGAVGCRWRAWQEWLLRSQGNRRG